MSPRLDRRSLGRVLAAAGAAMLSGCGKVAEQPALRGFVQSAEGLNQKLQRLLQNRSALATEFSPAEISPVFKANGETFPTTPEYQALAGRGFADYRLQIDGLVEQPLSLGLADLHAAPARSQITRHDCVEGWSCIGQWKGARLGPLLQRARLKPNARFIVFWCFDEWDGPPGRGLPYYESIDLIDAFHPQTILAYEMNGQPLPIAHGAPIRLRVERQLGYKMAKYVRRIQAVESFTQIRDGRGGYWPDRGYEWYAGI